MAPRTIKPAAGRSGRFTPAEARKAVRAVRAKKTLAAKKAFRPAKKAK